MRRTSKLCQTETPAIEYGLLTDRDGYPVSVQVYPGDTGAPKTVPDQPGKLKA